MPHRSAAMAKIELDLPEDLLHHVEDYAGRAGVTREEFLRRIIEEEIDRCHARLRKEIEDLLDSHPLDLGRKTGAELVRESRDSR
jgi:hypothetical protein